MSKKNRKTKEIHDFILKNVSAHKKDISVLTSQKFNLSRQSVSGHLNRLVKEDLLSASGMTRAREYKLRDYISTKFEFDVTDDLQEDVIWRKNISPLMEGIKKNVMDILYYGFTEMVNNVIDHSSSKKLEVIVYRNVINTQLIIRDFGIGIFKKIQQDFNLLDPRHSLLELSKGKLTSDDANHTGQGIFFTSRMFDTFNIWSEKLFYACTTENDEWLIETEDKTDSIQGTSINMEISENSDRTDLEIFNKYTSEFDDYGFTKTHIPLELLRYEGEKLVSRSQAKRLLARADEFNEIILDFKGITGIGQAFADEIFRVYKQNHPNIILYSINTTDEIDKMIARANPDGNSKQKSLFKK